MTLVRNVVTAIKVWLFFAVIFASGLGIAQVAGLRPDQSCPTPSRCRSILRKRITLS